MHSLPSSDGARAPFSGRSRARGCSTWACGCGASSLELAEAVGPTGSVVGVDIAAPMLERAQARARELGLSERVCFRQADAQVADLGAGAFDAVHSRFGIMFFDDPIAAFRNLRGALRTGGLVAFVCWRSVERNPWFTVTARAASAYLAFPEELPPKTPGPFGFAERSWIESVLGGVGFAELEIVSSDAPNGTRSRSRRSGRSSALDRACEPSAAGRRSVAEDSHPGRAGCEGRAWCLSDPERA